MRETVTYTLSYTLADAFKSWLDENGLRFDSYESGLYEVFEIEANEYEADAIEDFLNNDIHSYADAVACLDGIF